MEAIPVRFLLHRITPKWWKPWECYSRVGAKLPDGTVLWSCHASELEAVREVLRRVQEVWTHEAIRELGQQLQNIGTEIVPSNWPGRKWTS